MSSHCFMLSCFPGLAGSLGAPLSKQPPQLLSSAGQPAHHCSCRATQNTGDLLVAESLDVTKHDDLAILAGEFRDRLTNLLAFELPDVDDVRIRGEGLQPLDSAFVFGVQLDESRS